MKTTILYAIALIGALNMAVAQKTYPDLSGNYNIWKPESSQTTKLFKDGKKVQVNDANGRLSLQFATGNYKTPNLSWAWGTDADLRKVQDLVTARVGYTGESAYDKQGDIILEIEDGILVSFIGKMNTSEAGVCSDVVCKELRFVLYLDESKKAKLSEQVVKAKVNSMIKEMCNITKEKNAKSKDIRGLDNMNKEDITDFSKSKSLTGKYFVFRNDQVATRFLYTANQQVDIVDAGDHIDINSKLMKVKKITTIFDNTDEYAKIEKIGGHKILRAKDNTDNQTNGVASDFLVEIEEGVLVLLRDIGYRYFTKTEPCNANVDKIDYILFKDENACKNAQLGKIKTKTKEVLDAMCKAYTSGLEGPKSSVAVKLPPQNNKDTFVERMSWQAVKNFYKKQGWNEELIGCYISSDEWSYRTQKKIVNGSYKDVIISRYKNGVVFFKTSTGIYYVRGFSVAQDVVAGHLDGKEFQTKTLYCPGILDGAPGSGFDMQLTDKDLCEKYRRK